MYNHVGRTVSKHLQVHVGPSIQYKSIVNIIVTELVKIYGVTETSVGTNLD